jgi:hypothetical protein
LPTTIFVKDLSHLRELVKEDPTVVPLADSLVTRSRVSWGLVIAGGAIGLALVTLSFVFPQKDLCDTDIGCQENPNPGLLLGGLGALIVLPTVGWAIYPSRGSVLDVMNAWNTRHPDSQFTFSSR